MPKQSFGNAIWFFSADHYHDNMTYFLSLLHQVSKICLASFILASFILGCSSFVIAPSLEAQAHGGEPPREDALSVPSQERTHLKADRLTHDRELDVVTARGHVEITHGQRKVTADTVSYQRSLNRLVATGQVTVTDTDGTVTQSNYAELTGDLKDGFVRRVHVLFVDGAHAEARQGTRTDGVVTVLEDASYSACHPCQNQSSLWRVRAKEVTHDQKNRTVSYKNAWLEMRDIPILYTPYLSQPDPSVKRRSGLLAPSYGSNKDLGFSIKVPWFFTINDRQDVTISPIITTKEGLVLTAQHRAVAQKTSLSSSGSLTKDSRDDIRGHIASTLRHSINDTWRVGANMNLASDRTYLRRYRFGSAPFLESRAYIEGFTRRSYLSLEGLHFQNTGDTRLKEQDSPSVIPLGSAHYTSEPDGTLGSWTTLDFGLSGLHWEGGRRSQRLSSHVGWHVPYTSSGGSIYRADLDLYADAWHMDRMVLSSQNTYTGAAGRVIPEATVTWSFPLHRSQDERRDVLEPIVQGIISPRGGNPLEVANKDSLDFEVNDSNLFSRQRSPGRDRIETGSRLNYGMRYTAYGTPLGTFESVFGQSWRAYPDADIPELSGLNRHFSDYVGRVSLYPRPDFSASWRFRLDQETGDLRRSDASFHTKFSDITTTLGHVARHESGKNDSGTPLPYQHRQELYGSIESRLSPHWNAAAIGRWDITEGGGPLSTRGQISYEDECFVFSLEAGRDYTHDADFSGGTFIGLTLSFKTLGDFTTKF